LDPFLLHAVAAEAADRLLEQAVHRVARSGPSAWLIRFANASRDNLLLSVRPDLPRLHLLVRERRAAEEPPDPFAALLDREIGGAVLTALDRRPWDRVVEMRFRIAGGGERRLVVELLGRSANLVLLDAGGTIQAAARDIRSAFRAPVPGSVYAPPPGREDFAGLPEGPEALPAIAARFGGAVPFLRRLSPLFAREAEEDPAVLGRLLAAAAGGGWSPVVYSRGPLDFPETGRDDLVAAPLPLRGLSDRVATPVASPSEAAEIALGLAERARDFQGRREHHAALVRREIGRLAGLIRKLDEEQARARASDRFQRDGEALLAGLTAARVEGAEAIVPDPYDASGPPRRIAIDPALSLPENARLLFERYKKGKRGLRMIGARLAAVRRRLADWEALSGPAREVRTPADLDRLREAMGRLGTVHAAPAPRRGPAPRGPETPARVRRHTSPDGLEILVGRSGDENDRLTFRVAAPHDFWLHAAGRPGAHVVVRNPRRLKTLPDATLRLAAELAAFYSDARREGKVEVHYTQRKHVHKRRGMPAGQVLLRRFRSIQVAPRVPAATIEDV
jgi:predicted ribosome quality control (RQC) complex YloA/Tae2 family protein